MLKSALGKVMWVGRATVFLVGLAVILALVLGVASTAFGSNGQAFLLGRSNVATTVSTLINQGPGPALSLQVAPGSPQSPPLAVNSSTKVTNLNADQLDGKSDTDFYANGSKVADSELLDGKDSSELSSVYFFGTGNHFDLSSSGGVDQDVATLSGLPAGKYLVNANVSAVNFHTPDFFRCGLRVGGDNHPGSTTWAGNQNPVSQITATTAVSLTSPGDVTLHCGHDNDLSGSPYLEDIRISAIRTGELHVQQAP
jgi:hypothetical protein